MANAPTWISVQAGNEGSANGADYTIATSTPTAATTDFFFYFNSVDQNSNPITRLQAILALKGILGVLESNATYTTELEQ